MVRQWKARTLESALSALARGAVNALSPQDWQRAEAVATEKMKTADASGTSEAAAVLERINAGRKADALRRKAAEDRRAEEAADEAKRRADKAEAEAAAEAARKKEEEQIAERAAESLGGKPPKTLSDWRAMEEPLASAGLTAPLVVEFSEGKRCSFWFLRADKLRDFSGTTPHKLQELREEHPDWLEQRTINFVDGAAGAYLDTMLVISHRWEEPGEPDKQGAQFEAVKAHLNAKPSIELVWFECATTRSPAARYWRCHTTPCPCLPMPKNGASHLEASACAAALSGTRISYALAATGRCRRGAKRRTGRPPSSL